jgi:SAM-dependent methyltransferase
MNFKEKWKVCYTDCIKKNIYKNITPINYELGNKLDIFFKKYVHGKVLDFGAGSTYYKNQLLKYCDFYTGFDKLLETEGLDVIADGYFLPFKEEKFDVVFCSQVLEHIAYPEKILKTINKVLKKNGILILTVPHLSYLHGEPHDYFRYTKYGLEKLLFPNFKILKVIPSGGLLGFIFNNFSIILLTLSFYNKLLFKAVYYINYCLLRVIVFLDSIFDKKNIYAVNYVVVGEKKSE